MIDRKKAAEKVRWTPNVRVDVYAKGNKTNELMETKHEFTKVDSMWAKVIPQTGKLQNQQTETVLANVSHKVEVRYQAGKNITREMYLMCRGERFDIKYILNPYMKNEFLEIFCQQIIK
ncbi:phage head-tail adaptor, putative, SPP1 family [Tindallia californiensis]|uniref:Phage head-tail adaptor, putative, SPP1 family n=2 Tax=Tindallia californiensis TaxID=159292 RepID=A0A1H3R111_9FIRM|nr:phage head-tail adaptor, putative, SPP1 family [Tindallia californiensis]